jgi:hypothetical protein
MTVAAFAKEWLDWRKRTGLVSLPCTIEMDKIDAQKTPRFYEHETYTEKSPWSWR